MENDVQNPRRHTASRGKLEKVNLEGCKGCSDVYVSPRNAIRLGTSTGWHPIDSLQQSTPGENDQDIVLRIRGRVPGKVSGKRTCPNCK